MHLVRGVVQHYPWGDPTSLPRLLDVDPDGRPWAELWFGTHIGGASRIFDVDDAPIEGHRTHPDDTNGISRPLSSLAGELPYLLKVLAAARPLSLQTHPDEARAREGFARENSAGIPVGNSRRVYRDPFAKPELLCALDRFEAVCGFRRESDTVELLNSIGEGASKLARLIADEGLSYTLRYLFSGSAEARGLFDDVIDACRDAASIEAQWVTALAEAYPDDPAVVVTIMLNHVVLEPGQALFLGPGNLHAYLRGTGVEVMGSSDNVVRCGLTNKHVDVDEMLATVVTTPIFDPVLSPTLASKTPTGNLWTFDTPGAPFKLWMHDIDGAETLVAPTRELALCGVGSTDLLRRGEVCYLAPGQEITLEGRARIFRVTEARP